MKRILCFLIAALTLLPCVGARAAEVTRSADVVSVALSRLNEREGENNATEYGKWYGIPNGYWCDMFVSWCAAQAEVPASVFPRAASCTMHMKAFKKLGRYYASASRGGNYCPKQGDLVFMYDYTKNPEGDVLQHVGIVLCVENGYVFTVEGNTLTIRADYPYYEVIEPLRDDELGGLDDYVAVRYYPLTDPKIHGYASPEYQDLTPLPHDGFVDLEEYEPMRGAFETLTTLDIMPPTSSHTFSPRYGMTRGEFTAIVMRLFGFWEYDAETPSYEDVPAEHPFYGAIMAARAAGIASEDECFFPDRYVSGEEAQEMISGTLHLTGQEDRTFSFSAGDFSYLLTPYTIRADIAGALYELLSEMPEPQRPFSSICLNGEAADWPAMVVNGANYVSFYALQDAFAGLERSPDETLPVAMGRTGRVLLSSLTLARGTKEAAVPAFSFGGVPYVNLRAAADFLDLSLSWDGESMTVFLAQNTDAPQEG